MKIIVSVVNSITIFWFCFICFNYAIPYVCKSVLHLHSFPLLFILQAQMTKSSPMSLHAIKRHHQGPALHEYLSLAQPPSKNLLSS